MDELGATTAIAAGAETTDTTATRLSRALLARYGTTHEACARGVGMSTRQMSKWMNGHIPSILRRLERDGIIRIVDPSELKSLNSTSQNTTQE